MHEMPKEFLNLVAYKARVALLVQQMQVAIWTEAIDKAGKLAKELEAGREADQHQVVHEGEEAGDEEHGDDEGDEETHSDEPHSVQAVARRLNTPA